MKTIHLIYAANNKLFPHFPESSLALGGVLLKKGYQVKITDSVITPETEWNFENPLFFGITIYSNESIFNALSIAKRLRVTYPDVPMIWGGPHAQMVSEETAMHPYVDALCYDEGEVTIAQIADQLSKGYWEPDKIDGIMYRANGRIRKTAAVIPYDVTQLPYLPYQLIDLKRYSISSHKVYYQSSRGCPFSCTYCSYKHFRQWRGKSVEKVLGELGRIIKELRPAEIYFSDANFFVNLNRVRRICKGMISEKWGLRWTAFCRVDTVCRMDDEMLNLLKQSGCYQLDIGGESGSDNILKALNKGITRDMTLDTVERLSKAGIRPELSFMIGLPMETEEDLQMTLSLIDTIRDRFPISSTNGLFQYQPYPNTPLGRETIEQWNLPMPESLDDWARNPITIPRFEYFPWLTGREYSRMLMISSIVSYRFLYGRLMSSSESEALNNSLKFRLAKLFIKIVHVSFIRTSIYFRLKRKKDRFPIEWELYRFLRDRIIKMI